MGATTGVNRIFSVLSNIGPEKSIPSPEFIEGKMNEVLSAPEFQMQRDYLRELITEWLHKIFGNIRVEEGAINFTALAVFIVTALLLGVLIVAVTLLVSRMIGKDSRVTSSGKYINVEKLTAEAALERAKQEGSSGNYTSAVKWLFLSLLLMLDAEKYITLHESKTNRQYMIELTKNQYPHIELFQGLVMQFNHICYGGKPTTREDYLDWSQKIGMLAEEYKELGQLGSKGGDHH